jgi:hypothetical protein
MVTLILELACLGSDPNVTDCLWFESHSLAHVPALHNGETELLRSLWRLR